MKRKLFNKLQEMSKNKDVWDEETIANKINDVMDIIGKFPESRKDMKESHIGMWSENFDNNIDEIIKNKNKFINQDYEYISILVVKYIYMNFNILPKPLI